MCAVWDLERKKKLEEKVVEVGFKIDCIVKNEIVLLSVVKIRSLV